MTTSAVLILLRQAGRSLRKSCRAWVVLKHVWQPAARLTVGLQEGLLTVDCELQWRAGTKRLVYGALYKRFDLIPLQKGFFCKWNKFKSSCCLQTVAELKHLARQMKYHCPSCSDRLTETWGSRHRPTLRVKSGAVYSRLCPVFNLRSLLRYLVWRAD